MKPLPKRRVTIWRFSLEFYSSEFSAKQHAQWDDLYFGEVEKIPLELAELVAELHPNAPKYSAEAMAPLFKCYGTLRGSGTENPAFALQTISGHKWVVIRCLYEDFAEYPKAVADYWQRSHKYEPHLYKAGCSCAICLGR